MAYLDYNGQQVELVNSEDWRTDELIEAENALKIDFSDTMLGGRMAITYFVSIRRVDKDLPPGVLADAALRIKQGALHKEDADEEGEEGGPLANGDASPEIAARLTTGSQPSDTTST